MKFEQNNFNYKKDFQGVLVLTGMPIMRNISVITDCSQFSLLIYDMLVVSTFGHTQSPPTAKILDRVYYYVEVAVWIVLIGHVIISKMVINRCITLLNSNYRQRSMISASYIYISILAVFLSSVINMSRRLYNAIRSRITKWKDINNMFAKAEEETLEI